MPAPHPTRSIRRGNHADCRSKALRPRAAAPLWLGLVLLTVACGTEAATPPEDAEQRPSAPGSSDKTQVEGEAAARGDCTFDVSYELSPKISTVGVVTWATDFEPESAHIEFGLAGEKRTFVAPVDLQEPKWRTLLLGMKPERTYAFRIVAQRADGECSSPEYELTTGAVPASVPRIETQAFGTTPSERGFVITSAGVSGAALGPDAPGVPVFIFDADGDIVWYWEDTPPETGRALLDWDGRAMWMIAVNVTGGTGRVSRVSMDGLDFERDVAGLEHGHHDLAALPDGAVAVIAYRGKCSGVVERAPDGETRWVVRDVSTLYEPGGSVFGAAQECHPNSILYHPSDDSYTLSDRNANAFVKFTRDGKLLWQLGGKDPLGNHFQASWSVNHGHQLLDNGHFLLFSNGTGASSKVLELALDESTWQATTVWEYQNALGSFALGDVQRLSRGNTLITYSNAGVIFEVGPEGESVKEFTSDSFGYAMHRKSLYGPPPK